MEQRKTLGQMQMKRGTEVTGVSLSTSFYEVRTVKKQIPKKRSCTLYSSQNFCVLPKLYLSQKRTHAF